LALQVNLGTQGVGGVNLNQLVISDTSSANNGDATVSVLINGNSMATSVAFVSNTATINLNNYNLTGNQVLQVYLNFTNTAQGTYQLSVTSLTGSSMNNGGQPVTATPLPVSGYTVSCQPPTSTPVNTVTSTWTPTNTNTPTYTATITATSTPTCTFTSTTSGTITATYTSTPVALKVPVIYPNPVGGAGQVSIRPPVYTGNTVKVEIYTVAYRKVFNHTYELTYGNDVVLYAPITDNWNNPLASGVYYVVVTTNNGRSIGKMLVLR
jgi:hypothetical protein